MKWVIVYAESTGMMAGAACRDELTEEAIEFLSWFCDSEEDGEGIWGTYDLGQVEPSDDETLVCSAAIKDFSAHVEHRYGFPPSNDITLVDLEKVGFYEYCKHF